jgi:hypothetical protein
LYGQDGYIVIDALKKGVKKQVSINLYIPEEAIRLEHPDSEHPEPQPDPLG